MPFDNPKQESFTFITDENGAFTSLSPAVFYVLGYHPEELLGKTFASLASRDSFGRSSAFMYRLLRERQPFRGEEIGLSCRDGRSLEAEISGRPLGVPGKFQGYQGVVLAISEYRLLPEEPCRREPEAGLILELVCHDVNNMNMVQIGYLEMALDTLAPDSPAYRYINKCLASVNGSAELLRNVQKLQEITTGARTLEKVDIGKMLVEATGQFAGSEGRDIRINLALAPDCHVMANALLKDAFVNIVGNAVKHSAGPLVIDVRVEKVTELMRHCCKVTIEDNGPGIPDDIKPRLFSRFEWGSAVSGGKGLGLYLVRRLIEGYEGHVRVEDRIAGDYHRGSRFIVILPLADI